MKPFIEKLNLNDQHSFYAKTHNTPKFEVGWHQHLELELIVFYEGHGTAFIDNYMGTFTKGDIFFVGENLPHTFQKAHQDLFVSALVIQFKKNFWGNEFLALPECRPIFELFQEAMYGLKITGRLKYSLGKLLAEIENCSGLKRVMKLAESLQMVEQSRQYDKLLECNIKQFNLFKHERIDKIYQYALSHFHEPITLEDAAGVAAMSVPAFCKYFKKSTKKTYKEFLNELRINKACTQLIETDRCINDICRNCGFNNIANFNRQFHRLKLMTPSQYRKVYQNNSIIPT